MKKLKSYIPTHKNTTVVFCVVGVIFCFLIYDYFNNYSGLIFDSISIVVLTCFIRNKNNRDLFNKVDGYFRKNSLDESKADKALKEFAQKNGFTSTDKLGNILLKNARGPLDRAIGYVAKKEYQTAIDLLKEVNSLQEKKEGEFYLALAYFGQKEYELAATNFGISAKLTNDDQAYYSWGFALDKLGKPHEAIEKYKKAIEINPENDYAYQGWGANLDDLEKYPEAIKKYKKAIEINPENDYAYQGWGFAFGKLGRHPEAIKKYKKAIEINPKNDTAYLGWGVALDELGKYGDAIEQYKKAVAINSQFDDAYYNWGVALEKLGKYQEALEKFERAQKIIAKKKN